MIEHCGDSLPQRATRKMWFLDEMTVYVPWMWFESLIESRLVPTNDKIRLQDIPTQLRIFLMQRWFRLSDSAMADALVDIRPLSHFARLEQGNHPAPDEEKIRDFRRAMEESGLAEEISTGLQERLEFEGLRLKHGAMSEAMLVIDSVESSEVSEPEN